jgi:hypothetical protein
VATTHNKGKTNETTDRQEQKIALAPDTVLLVNNVTGLSDLMYHTLPLKAGESFNVMAFLPENPDKMLVTVTVDVRPEQEVIDIGGKNYKVFVCDVFASNIETDYVTEDGTLVKVEISSEDTTPPQKVTIELVD